MAIAVPIPDRVATQAGATQAAILIGATRAGATQAGATQAGETRVAILIVATRAGATRAGETQAEGTGVAILIAATQAGGTGAAILVAATQAESGTGSGAIMIAMNETNIAHTVIADQTSISASAPVMRTGQPTVTAMDTIRATRLRHAVTMTAGVTGAPIPRVTTATTTTTTTVIKNAVGA